VPLLNKTDFSFPSGHATFFMALGFGIFFSHKKAGYVFIFFALLIGIARIIAGVHFPVDILSGFILGAIIAYLVRVIYNKIYKKTPN
jgi:undecaprenyl-diphosphatase